LNRFKLLIISLIMFMSLCACNSSTTSSESDLKTVANNIQYIKKDGRCYALLRSEPHGTLGREVYSITHIPCE
jgi:hypothetical protein